MRIIPRCLINICDTGNPTVTRIPTFLSNTTRLGSRQGPPPLGNVAFVGIVGVSMEAVHGIGDGRSRWVALESPRDPAGYTMRFQYRPCRLVDQHGGDEGVTRTTSSRSLELVSGQL